LEIDYLKGEKNVVADFLSRPPQVDQLGGEELEMDRTFWTQPGSEEGCAYVWSSVWERAGEGVLWSVQDDEGGLVLDEGWDSFMDGMLAELNGEDINGLENSIKMRISKDKRDYVVRDGKLFRYLEEKGGTFYQLCVKSMMWASIVDMCHEDDISGHMSFRASYYRWKRQYYFPTMRQMLLQKVASCSNCSLSRDRRKERDLSDPIAPYMEPFEVVMIDFTEPIDPVAADGEKYILVVTCLATKWVEAFPTYDCTAETAARLLISEVFCRYGFPTIVRCDNGVHFRANLFKEVVRLCNSKLRFGKVYYPNHKDWLRDPTELSRTS